MQTKSFQHNFTIHGTDESKPILLMVHGFGTSQNVWHFLREDLLTNFRLAMYDHAGATEQSNLAYTPDRYKTLYGFAEDLVALCDENNLHNIPVLGHSMGGMSAVLASLMRPDLFTHLLLLAPSPCFQNDHEHNYLGGFSENDLKSLFATIEQDYYAWVAGFAPIAMGNTNRPELGTYFANTLKSVRPDIALQVARVIFSIDYRKEIERITIPTLIMQTQSDIAVPLHVAEYMQSHIPRSVLKIVETDGHLPHVSAPRQVAQYIREFLQ